MIELTDRDGHTLSAYRADPGGAPKGAVVVLPQTTGDDARVQRLAEDFAANGYVAIAPLLFDGVETEQVPAPDEASLPEDQEPPRPSENNRAFAGIQAAVDSVSGAGKVAVVGYAHGGYLAYVSANRVTGLACAISYYGQGVVEEYHAKRKIPTLLHFGEVDAAIPNEKVVQFRSHRPDVSAFTYPGAGRGFDCDGNEEYRPDAARTALDRTLFWISQYVQGQAPIALKNAGAYAQAKVDKKNKPKAEADDMGPPPD